MLALPPGRCRRELKFESLVIEALIGGLEVGLMAYAAMNFLLLGWDSISVMVQAHFISANVPSGNPEFDFLIGWIRGMDFQFRVA
jgi:hypothetical protein